MLALLLSNRVFEIFNEKLLVENNIPKAPPFSAEFYLNSDFVIEDTDNFYT